MDNYIKLLDKYKDDEALLLKENPKLENLYVFSNQREGAIEWIDFKGGDVLVINDEYGAVIAPLLEKKLNVSLYEENVKSIDFIKKRYADYKLSFLNNGLENINQKFDYIVFLANRKNEGVSISKLENLSLIKDKLNENGKLILCCDNRFGIQTLAGAKELEESLSRNEINIKLSKAGFKDWNFYYPIYDYKLPFSIYSDDYLPSKSDISRYLPAYNYPEFLNTDIAEKFASSAETNDFINLANSYIVITGKKENAIYVKYNRTRRKELRIKTVIEQDEKGNKRVCKGALSKESKTHIQSLKENFDKLLAENNEVSYLKTEFSEDGFNAYFPYVKGKSLTSYLGEKIVDENLPVAEIEKAFEKICKETGSLNHDAIFDNFIIEDFNTNDYKLIGIDYEWVWKTPLEKKYLYYRALKAFFESFSDKLGLSNENSYIILYKRFGITDEDIERFKTLEKEFQDFVHGESQKIYLDNYFITPRTEEVVKHFRKEAEIAKEREQGVLKVIKERDKTIKKITEVKRLTDNHVVNLENIIANLRNENENLVQALNVFKRHEAIIYKIKRKLVSKLDKMYPQGSIGRKKLNYLKLAVTKPSEYIRLKTTKEGKNLIEGDFKIGEDYKKYGKLTFPKFENPKVSIVIPVYNQINYTYLCLVSILENTKDVTYEVIIADDVSTDATKELDKFAQNLVISRNETNQGFLKNCNQAAKKARGEYIMFLNNDTKVTPNWLSSLVELIEKDKSIGMVGSKLIYPDGRLQEAGGIIWSDGSGWNYGRLDDPSKCEYNYVKEVDYISGAAILISKELWKNIGGFDERFAPAYCEDSDLAFEVRKAGYKVCLQPKSVVVHFEGISNGTDVNGSGLKKYQVENSLKLREKWSKEFALQFENNGDPDPFRARERSKDKKIILFIDHYVPTYDKDAGSKTTFQYIKMLISRGYIIKFLGDNFAKQEPYTSTLEQMGVEILYGMQADIWSWIEKHAKDIHLVYMNRPHIATKYIDFIRDHTNLKVVYYGHDLHFLRLMREYELTKDESKKDESDYWKTIELNLMYKADMSYYPSQTEVDCIKNIDPDIRVKAITAYVYEDFIDKSKLDFEKKEGLLFVGGFSHPPNADALKWFIKEIFPSIRAKKDINFYIVGSNATEDIKALHNPSEGIIFKGFVSDEELEDLYANTRVVVVPLRYGAGIKGKVIEALHNGAAVVTTSVGAEGIPSAKRVMKITDEAEDFAKEVLKVYENEEEIKYLSFEAISYIRDNNSYNGAWRIISEEFE